MIPIVPLQDAIYNAITSHPAMDKWLDVVAVGDNLRDTDAPIVQLGLFYLLTEASSFDDEPMYEGSFQLRVHTPVTSGGTMYLAALMSDLDTAVQPIDTIDGWHVVVPIRNIGITTNPSRDEATGDPIRLGVLEYSIQIEKLP